MNQAMIDRCIYVSLILMFCVVVGSGWWRSDYIDSQISEKMARQYSILSNDLARVMSIGITNIAGIVSGRVASPGPASSLPAVRSVAGLTIGIAFGRPAAFHSGRAFYSGDYLGGGQISAICSDCVVLSDGSKLIPSMEVSIND